MQRMTGKCGMLAVLVIMTAVMALWPGYTAFAAASEDIMFQLLRGRAALSRNGGGTWLELGPEPVAVKVQDMLRTEGETRGEMRFPDGSLFRIKSNSRVTLVNDGIQLQVGESWFNLKKQGRTFQVVTPTTVCGVLGTTFDVNVDRFGQTRVRVFEGLVSVKAHEDRRKRQLVLQKGMMASIRDRAQTAEQFQKFDAAGEDARIQGEWKNLTPQKLGPARPQMPEGLPPMRQPASGGWKPVFKEGERSDAGGVLPDGKSSSAEPSGTGIRENLAFFEKMREQRLEGRRQQGEEEAGRNQASGGMDAIALRQGLGARFGEAGRGPVGAQEQRALREEYLRTQNRLVQVQEELRRTVSELEALRSKLNANSAGGMTKEEIRQRMVVLVARLELLREQQIKLLQRLENLRNRLS
ncbi:MAG TPA: FecR domain-containing protein [Candidatus Ozemobacteraceae bacterium]